MKIQRAIISGATGTIGTALTELLVKNGIEVLVLTRPDSERNHRIIQSPLVHVLCCDYAKLDEIGNETEKTWDCFFHFAWAGAAGPGRNDMYLQNHNVKVSLDAVKMAWRFGCRKFMGAGSQAEYGRSNTRLTPKTPTFPENGYGYAKLCAGYMTRELAHQLGMEHDWLRVLSTYGLNDGVNSMIAQTIRSLGRGESLEYTGGEQIWDFIYNKDAAQAFFRVAEKGHDGKVYILGSGHERPLREYLEITRDIVAPNVELKLGVRPYSENQIMYLAADNTELIKDTGYEPRFSFEEGIRDMMGKDPLC